MAEPLVASNRRPRLAGGVLLAVIFSLLAVAIYLLQKRMDEHFGDYRSTEEILYIEDGKLLKKMLLGFENLAADLYWLRTVQYFGGKRLYDPEKRFDLLEPLLNVTTDLDPHMKIAYRYGAVFLSEAWPRGAGLPLKAVELVDKGILNNPDDWRFFLDKGFIYFWHLQDPKKAAEIFLEGSEVPGAPYWMAATAGRALIKGGDRETARILWKALYDLAETGQMRGNAEIHLQQLDALDEIDALTERAKQFQEQAGRFPRTWAEVVAAGLLRGIPLDPTGAPYSLNPRDETVELSPRSSLAGLPSR